MSDYSKGGYIPSIGNLPTAVVRTRDGRREYWDLKLGHWVPVMTYAEIRAMADPELSNDYQQNDHT
jgi:hypothetical protein